MGTPALEVLTHAAALAGTSYISPVSCSTLIISDSFLSNCQERPSRLFRGRCTKVSKTAALQQRHVTHHQPPLDGLLTRLECCSSSRALRTSHDRLLDREELVPNRVRLLHRRRCTAAHVHVGLSVGGSWFPHRIRCRPSPTPSWSRPACLLPRCKAHLT